ncbi:MAG TPA: GGDEF domain-containing protein [Thermoanaerobaculia bacterium]
MKDGSPQELLLRLERLEQQVCELEDQLRLEESRRRAEQGLVEELRLLAHRDALTGLANRFALEEALEQELERARRKAHVTSVALFDVDGFKRINDRFGHERGDAVLRLVAGVLGAVKRAYDTAGRWGGDEFLLVLPETTLGEATHVAERVREAVARIPPEDCGPLSISGGVCSSEQSGEWEALLRLADTALYRAKEQGRDRIVRAPAARSA